MRIINVWTIFWLFLDAGVLLPHVQGYMRGLELSPLFYWGILISIYLGIAIFMLETLVESPKLWKFLGSTILFWIILHYGV
jgi:hypothetical protein